MLAGICGRGLTLQRSLINCKMFQRLDFIPLVLRGQAFLSNPISGERVRFFFLRGNIFITEEAKANFEINRKCHWLLRV